MATSPAINSDGVLRVSIDSDGTTLPGTFEIVSVEIETRLNRIGSATIVFNDGDMPLGDFPLSGSDLLTPGKTLTITAGYNDPTHTLYTGIIVKHSIRIGANNASRLVVECKDKALKMTVARKNACYVNMKDSDIISRLIGEYSGLTAAVTATTVDYPELVQYHCSDWDYMLARAEASGMVVISDGSTVTVGPPVVSGSPALVATYGVDIMDFHAELDARAQYASVTTASWDPATQDTTEQQARAEEFTAQGNIQSAALAQVLEANDFRLQSNAALSASALTAWAKAQQLKVKMARVRGHVSFQGNAEAKVGGLMALAGVGTRFTGTVYVSGVTHTLNDGNWVTRVDFGLAPTWFTERHDLATPLASGLTAGISGLQIGVVAKLDADPEGHHKVQVAMPLMKNDAEKLVWARLAKFYASSTFGAFFLPEIGDEVILGFINDDPSHPVILGSLYSSRNKPPYALAAENNTKAIVTRSKLKLIFDEEKKKITLITPADNKIVIDDDSKSILIEDQTKNKVELHTGGITLDSPKDIKINATGNVTIEAGKNVEIKAGVDIKETATNVTHTANVGFTAKGSATAEVSAGGNTTIKGALVMIN